MRALCLLAAVLSWGCSGDDDDDDSGADGDADSDADTDADGDSDTPSFDAAPSTIRVVERGGGTGEEYGGWVNAVLLAEPYPDPHVETLREGACRMREFEPVFCDPWCDNGLCVAENTCAPYPRLIDAGTITITGLDEPFSTEFVPGTGYANSGDFATSVFTDGSEVEAVAAGGADVTAFSLGATGVAALETDLGGGLDIRGGGAIELAWEPAGSDSGSRVRARLITDRGHGPLPPVIVECDSADDGSIVVPAAMVEALGDPDNWACGDCFSSTIERYTRSEIVAGDYEIELVVASQVSIYLQRF